MKAREGLATIYGGDYGAEGFEEVEVTTHFYDIRYRYRTLGFRCRRKGNTTCLT